MRLFVGLGNPGAKYAQHRHNIGFMAVDEIARRHGFAPWRRRFQGETAEGTLERERVILLKPMTFMNDSGRAVQEAASFFKLGQG
ncbi:MAG: peptidyl-tRNA hydrolase, family, partial [Bradyrhizobium sp.]|nr:peptidyl-tRNA hydrolase, family [Bradyrhizobium sp.]